MKSHGFHCYFTTFVTFISVQLIYYGNYLDILNFILEFKIQMLFKYTEVVQLSIHTEEIPFIVNSICFPIIEPNNT